MPETQVGGIQIGGAQIGGAQFQGAVAQWFKQSENLFTVVFYAVVFVWTGFVDKLPAVWRWQLSTSIGRLFFVLLLWIVLEVGGWVPATLVAVAICMTWAVRPLFAPQGFAEGFASVEAFASAEAFASVEGVKRTAASGHLWFVEKALKENPKEIVEDRVTTDAITDGSDKIRGSRTSR